MNEFTIARILARPEHNMSCDDQAMLRSMAAYLDRNSLKIVGDNGASGNEFEIRVSNDAERFFLTLAELRDLWSALKRGQPVDWDRLRRA